MSARWDFPRNVASTRILVNVGQAHGLSVSDCLAGSGLSSEQLAQSDYLVQAGQELQVIRNLLLQLGPDRPLAYEAGLQYHPTTFGVWGFAMLSSRTVREAIEVALKYLRLTSIYVAVAIEEGPEEISFVTPDDDLPADVRAFLVERDAVSTINLQRDVLPMRLPFISLEMRRSRPVYAALYDDYFGVPVKYHQPRNCIVGSASLADLTLPQGDASALKMCEAECRKLLAARTRSTDFASRVRNRLILSTLEMPSMEMMAQAFDMTSRTLRRRLAEEGCDYATLVTEVRRTLAEEMLRTTDFSIEEIAERLGYSEPPSFIRAFKRWHGLTPRQYRLSA